MSKGIEQLKAWTGSFGLDYTKRNSFSPAALDRLYRQNYGVTRVQMNKMFLSRFNNSIKILEVGCNIGNQLVCLQKMGFKNLYGIEPQQAAVEKGKKITKRINIIRGDVFEIPFKDNYFDIVFTSGLLIHISPKNIRKALREIYRCSRRYIWGFEYYSKKYENIIYRGQNNLLWKADFPKMYTSVFPDSEIVKTIFFKYLESDNCDIMFLLEKKNA